MADQGSSWLTSEHGRWVIVAIVSVFFKEMWSRLFRLQRPKKPEVLTREQVSEMISAYLISHSHAVKDASYFDRRIRGMEEANDSRFGELMADVETIKQILERRSHDPGHRAVGAD